MADVLIKRGDTSREFTDTLKLDGSIINLTGADVVLVFSRDGTATRRDAEIVDPLAGTVKYKPVAADVGTEGVVLLEWEITFVDTEVLTIPTDGYIKLTIYPDLG